LALWQANYVANLIQKKYPNTATSIIELTTNGDRIQDKSLATLGGKGLFIKELEVALMNNEADIAVHSLKDLPAKLDNTFILAAILPREDATDAFISNKYTAIEMLPSGAIIGTSSPRRAALIKKHYPQLRVKLLRGNVDTRLAKLDDNEYDAIILATAGLKRLNLAARIKESLPITKFIPAIAQGAIGIEVMAQNTAIYEMLKILDDKNTRIAIECEREVGYILGASCHLPIAVHAHILDSQLIVEAMLLDEDGLAYYSKQITAIENRFDLAKRCVEDLMYQGAQKLLDKYL
jgi:hydroxymethylbilane synthase